MTVRLRLNELPPQTESDRYMLSKLSSSGSNIREEELPPSDASLEQVEQHANEEFDYSQKENVSVEDARIKLTNQRQDETLKKSKEELARYNMIRSGVEEVVAKEMASDLQGHLERIGKTPDVEISAGQRLKELQYSVERGALQVVKAPGVVLKAAGEQAPTREERLARQERVGSTPVSKALDEAALFVTEGLKSAGDNCIAYWNDVAETSIPTIDEIEWAKQQPFTQYPLIQTTSAVGESAPAFGAAVAATLITKNPTIGAAVIGTSAATQSYEDLRADGVAPDLALVGSAVIGSIEILTEKVPMDVLLKGGAKRLLIRMLETGSKEAVQELLAQLGQNYVQAVVKDIDPDDPSYQNLLNVAQQEWSTISEGWQVAMSSGGVMGFTAGAFSSRPDLGRNAEELLSEYQLNPAADKAFEETVERIRNQVKAVDKVQEDVSRETAVEAPTEPAIKKPETLTGVEGTGETVTRGLSQSVEDRAIEAELVDTLGELPEYQRVNMKEQARIANDLITNEPDRAMRIAAGQEAAPAGLYEEALFTAMEKTARDAGDVSTLRELANSQLVERATVMGQRIKALDPGKQENTPARDMKDISDARRKTAERRKQAVPSQQEVDTLQKRVDELEAKLAQKAVGQRKPTRRSKKYGESNKLVKKSEYEEVMARRGRPAPLQMSMGVPTPTDLADLTKVALYHMEAVGRNFADWSAQIVRDLGDWVKPYLKDEYNKALSEINKLSVSELKNRASGTVQGEYTINQLGLLTNQIAKHYIETGITERTSLVNVVHRFLREFIPDITTRQTQDLISGYGQQKLLSKQEVDVILRDIRGQLQNISKIEDLEAGKAPLKTGQERRVPSDEERRLIQQVNELKKKYNIKTTDPSKQLASALDAVKKRLENQIRDLQIQIETGEKLVQGKTQLPFDQEVAALRKQRDALKSDYDKIFPKDKKKISGQQKLERAIRATESSIARYAERIKKGDISTQKKQAGPTSEGLETLRAIRDGLKSQLAELRAIAKPTKSPEEVALMRLKTRLKNEAARLQESFTRGEFEKPEKRSIKLDDEARKLKEQRDVAKEKLRAAREAGGDITQQEAEQIALLSSIAAEKKEVMLNSKRRKSAGKSTQTEMEWGTAQVLYTEYVEALKAKAEKLTLSETMVQYLKDPLKGLSDIAGVLRSIVASWDNSFIGRQGLLLFYKGATLDTKSAKIWADTFAGSWMTIWKTLTNNGEQARIALRAMQISDPEYELIRKTKTDIGTIEEEFPSDLPTKIPLLGKIFSASENAYVWSAHYMRYRVVKMELEIYRNSGGDMTNTREFESIGKVVNSLTGRGKIGRAGSTPGFVNNVFFSPRYLKSSIDFMTFHLFDPNVSVRMKKRAAMNLVRFISGAAAILLIADFIDDESVTWDTNSADFGKIKVGNTRFSVGGSIPALIVLTSRIATGSTTNSVTGEKKKLNTGKFLGKTKLDLAYDFFENKFSPGAQYVATLLRGREKFSSEFTEKYGPLASMTPLSIQNILEAAPIEDRAHLILIMTAEGLGVSVQTYEPRQKTSGAFD